MSNIYHLKALLKKNLIIMKRNIFVTICEVFSPMILMFLVYLLRTAFKIEYLTGDDEDYFEFLVKNSTALTNDYNIYGLFPYKGTIAICSFNYPIALIGKNFPDDLKQIFIDLSYTELYFMDFIYYETIEDFEDYIQSSKYGSNEENPEICFGIYYNHDEVNNKYDISLHYFCTHEYNWMNVPSTLEPNLDVFIKGPEYEETGKYLYNGYLNVMKKIYDYILYKETGVDDASIDMVVLSLPFSLFIRDKFEKFMGYMLGFFLIVTYAIPLTRYLFVIVKEKEIKSKEGMKIMGLSELYYFLSYFIQYFVLNILYTIANSLILSLVFKHIPLIYLFLFFFLFGMSIFALVYFFQSFLDKTRLAMIVSILIYFLMYFLSTSFTGNGIKHWVRVFFSIFPPIALQIGLNVMSRFEVTQKDFKKGDVTLQYRNYCIRDMLIMLTIDIFIYLFLGFYLENVVTHDFGMSRPWNFLCTKSYWGCGNKKKKIKNELENNKENNNKNIIQNNEKEKINQKNKEENNSSNSIKIYSKDNQQNKNNIQNQETQSENFQSEEIYSDLTKPGDKLILKNIKKTFSDGKKALNGVSFNLYKNEIFALLGHNGAGKSTLISILTGLYTSTEGEAEYNDENILNESNMDEFRKILGICPQHDVLFPNLTVEEHLRLFCTFKGLTNDDDINNEIDKSLHDFSL